jgi:predicted DNA-binding protein YlxM (UPF0122 family)
MSSGYSYRFAQAVNSADTNKLGVQLGNLCIKHDIPVSEVASHFGVTRTTVYNWFKGLTNVSLLQQEEVAKFIKKLMDK